MAVSRVNEGLGGALACEDGVPDGVPDGVGGERDPEREGEMEVGTIPSVLAEVLVPGSEGKNCQTGRTGLQRWKLTGGVRDVGRRVER